MNNVVIFISKYENTLNGAFLLKKELKFCNIIFIEDYINNKKNIKIDNSIIYFLCNSPLIKKVIELLDNNCYVYNKKYYLNNYKKKDVQILLNKNKIIVPRIINYLNLKESDFPIFCKENNHVGITFQVYNKITLKKFFERFNIKDFYLEKKVNSENKEFKVYYVNNNIYYNDNKKNNKEIKNICYKISRILNLELFSVDFIKEKKDYYIIDVNPASAFYLSPKARKSFIDITKDKIKVICV